MSGHVQVFARIIAKNVTVWENKTEYIREYIQVLKFTPQHWIRFSFQGKVANTPTALTRFSPFLDSPGYFFPTKFGLRYFLGQFSPLTIPTQITLFLLHELLRVVRVNHVVPGKLLQYYYSTRIQD